MPSVGFFRLTARSVLCVCMERNSLPNVPGPDNSHNRRRVVFLLQCMSPLSRSLLGAKRTSLFATHISAFDPKRTSPDQKTSLKLHPNLLCLVSVGPRPSNGMVACTGEIS